MTQVISVITEQYVLLASDRRLTLLNGPHKGELVDDDTCKLVSLCNICGIGYTGLAQIEGIPAHEWIAKVLAEENCSDPEAGSRVLSQRATTALSSLSPTIRRQEFVIAGWSYFKNLVGLRSHICLVTNMRDSFGPAAANPHDRFHVLVKALNDNDSGFAFCIIGQPLNLERRQLLTRNIKKLVDRELSPKEALRLIIDEVIHTSEHCETVGKKILGFCIPRRAAESTFKNGESPLLAMQPNNEAAAFCYYDSGYNELQQFGPTMTCRGYAATDLQTENDPATNSQNAQLKILSMPKSIGKNTIEPIPVFKMPSKDRTIIGFELGISVNHIVAPNSICVIPAAIRNTGQIPIVFAPKLTDEVGHEIDPSIQGGAIPAISFAWPIGKWAIKSFNAVSRSKFAGITINPGNIFEFNFGSFRVPIAPMGSLTRTSVVDFIIRFTDTILGQFLNTRGVEFNLPTNVNPTLSFRIGRKLIQSRLSFYPARVIDTSTGELLSGPVNGTPTGVSSLSITDTSIASGKPGFFVG